MMDIQRISEATELILAARIDADISDFFGVLDYNASQGEMCDLSIAMCVFELIHSENFVPPAFVCRFISEILASREALTVLDPSAGDGWLPAWIGNSNPRASVVARSDSELAAGILERFGQGRVRIQQAIPEEARFDAMVSLPPINSMGRQDYRAPDGFVVVDRSYLVRMAAVSRRLADDGIVVWLVASSFAFEKSKRSVRKNLQRFGLRLSALLRIRPGSFAPQIQVAFDLALLEKVESGNLADKHETIFVAEVPEEDEAQDQLIQRIRARTEGSEISQGRIVDASTYCGLPALEAADRARRLGANAGLQPVGLSQVILEVRRPRKAPKAHQDVEPHPDAVYLPEMGRTRAGTSLDQLPEGLKSYLQLVINREVALPEFLAEWFNSPVGYAVRESAMAGTAQQRISPDRLSAAIAYLPPIEIQREAAEANSLLRLLETELQELRFDLWNRPRRAREILEETRQVNHEDRFEDWIETLPFPLASILRAYHARDTDDRSKYERLLHFFEATAAFCAAVHVSAAKNRPNWAEHRIAFARAARDAGTKWDRPTFGTWKTAIDCVAREVRQDLNDAERRPIVLNAYGLNDPRPLEFLVGRKLLAVLHQTINLRNRWSGHGGDVSDQLAAERHKVLAGSLNDFRSACGRAFALYELVIPGSCNVEPGPVFSCMMRKAMGSNPEFGQVEARLTTAAVGDRLHMLSPGQTTALELVGLVQVDAAPPVTCWFFNHSTADGPQLVSYHHGDVSHIPDPSGTVAELIAELSLEPPKPES